MSRSDRPALGIILMIVTMLIFAAQDGISRHLAERYNVLTVVMIRYWFFALFVCALSAMQSGGIRHAARSNRPWLQISRGVLLALEVVVTVIAFVELGLVATHSIFASFPLIVTALSVPILGEKVGWRRWLAVVIGFIGVLVILRPGVQPITWAMLVPLGAAFLFAFYHILTRLAARTDTTQTSFFWTGVAGAVAITCIGPFFWDPMRGDDWYWMGALCVTSVTGHFLLIKALSFAEASVVQPFTYFQLIFAIAIGVFVFAEVLDGWTLMGTLIIASAGLFTFVRQGMRRRVIPPA